MMKKLTQKQEKEIEQLEESGDNLLDKPSFNNCMDAIDIFIKAQDLLIKYANDNDAANEYGELKTKSLDYKIWHSNLIKKMNIAQQMLTKPNVLRK